MLAAVSFCRMQTSPKPSFDIETAITISAVANSSAHIA